MVTATQLKDWLKKLVDVPSWTVGKLDASKEKTVCVYTGLAPPPAILSAAGSERSYDVQDFRVLVRWGKRFPDCERMAGAVFGLLRQQTTVISGKSASIIPVYAAPISLGSDDKGVFEHAIEVRILSGREEV